MIIYVTKQTAERYKIDVDARRISPVKAFTDAVIEREGGDRLLEWGAKLFYFDRRKCLEVANFASKFTLFLVNIKVDDLQNIGNLMAHYMFYIYENDPEMTALLGRFFEEYPFCVFSKLTDKSNIAHLNHTLLDFAWDGYRLGEYIENGVLHSMEFNKYFNTEWPVPWTVDGEKDYIRAAEKFKELLVARYPRPRRPASPRPRRP